MNHFRVRTDALPWPAHALRRPGTRIDGGAGQECGRRKPHPAGGAPDWHRSYE